ncbi:MAG: mannose-1-phosphate guanylyltransferase [Janthinobacterium lividum]
MNRIDPATATAPQSELVPVVLAGGSGTRFWPRSRRARAKQVLALSGEETMIQQTVDRLRPLASIDDFLVITNQLLTDTIREQLPTVPEDRILREPCARNTAPACALAAMIVEQMSPDTVLGVFPSDHVVVDQARFAEIIRAGVQIASAGENIVVLGAPPTRPETGYGYIRMGDAAPQLGQGSVETRCVQRFTEKPNIDRALEFLADGNYAWNAGIFLWSARTLSNAIREYRPAMAAPLQRIAEAHGTPEFDQVFAEEYPKVENISIDYAVLEPRSARGADSHIYCLPADFGWNDLGSWAALHEHAMSQGKSIGHGNVMEAGLSLHLDAFGNYAYAPGKVVALLGVSDLVVVQTEDALLVTTRAHSQEVGRIVSELVKLSRPEFV